VGIHAAATTGTDCKRCEYGYAKKNPARDVGRLRGTNPKGIRVWTEADAVRYEARHPIGTKVRLASRFRGNDE
jgi:hypothetical protein